MINYNYMKKILLLGLVSFIPLQTFAAFGGIANLIISARGIVDILIPLAFACALLFFFYGVARFLFRAGGDVGAIEDGKKLMLWGIIALFVISSIWGIVVFVQRQLVLPTNNSIQPPTVGGGNGGTLCDPVLGVGC